MNTIGEGAFGDDSNIKGTLNFPPTLTTIRAFAFANCTGIDGSLNMSNNVRFIGEGAFLNLCNLKEIHLDWSTAASTIIEDEAFFFNTTDTSFTHYVYLPINSRVNFDDLVGLNSAE